MTKTVLEPSAPWPKVDKKPYRQKVVGLKQIRIAFDNTSLDYFKKTYDELCDLKASKRLNKNG